MTDASLAIVVVLYRVSATRSLALTSLADALSGRDVTPPVFVHDNTEGVVAEPDTPDVVTSVTRHPDNPGLALAYREAAGQAGSAGCAWLLLLDQDTRVTREFVDEVLALLDGDGVPGGVDVLVPRVVDGGRVVSPHRRVRLRTRPVETTPPGVVDGPCSWVNSGAVVRLSALRAVGGFPAGFPLDYLDHVTATVLQDSGSRVLLLRSTLEHRLSLLDRRSLPAGRLDAVLRAEERYYAQHGRVSDAGWLLARRLAGTTLSVVRLRPSPSRRSELAGVARSFGVLTTRRTRG